MVGCVRCCLLLVVQESGVARRVGSAVTPCLLAAWDEARGRQARSTALGQARSTARVVSAAGVLGLRLVCGGQPWGQTSCLSCSLAMAQLAQYRPRVRLTVDEGSEGGGRFGRLRRAFLCRHGGRLAAQGSLWPCSRRLSMAFASSRCVQSSKRTRTARLPQRARDVPLARCP